ncbi:MAG: metallophosphoesterase family protein [Microcoleaceae cyanobacterium]
MAIDRRHFLRIAGGLWGLGLTTSCHELMTQADLPQRSPGDSFPDPPAPSTVQPPPPPIKVAPEGLFAPVKGDVRWVVISDLNSRYGSTTYESQVAEAIALIPQWQPDLILCAGDMVAGQKLSLSPATLRAMWEGFDQTVAAPLRALNLPFGMTMGNHDASGDLDASGAFVFKTERDVAQAYWKDARHRLNLELIDATGFPFYYSFLRNEIFHLVWDASSYRIPDQQLDWAKKSLTSSPAQTAKLRIVMGHLPLYAVSTARDKFGEILQPADELRALLEQHDVHLYISGHHHAYFPGHRGQLKLLFSGALGSGPRPLMDSDLPPQNTLTVVDVDLQQSITRYTTYDMKTLQVISPSTFPQKITGENGWVLREDVQEETA